ncbi:hypothetical protein VPH35_001821 [Triticum aestivum]
MKPADQVEIWEAILADPLDWLPSSVTIPRPSQVEEYFSYVYGDDDMEINKFAQEPEDGQCHQQYLGEFILNKNGRCAPQGPRKRRIFPSESRGKKLHSRKNNEHWTLEEVKKLIRGVRRYGERRWTKVKRHYFSSSVRKPTHLKDKWRNIRRACGVPCRSKRKEKAQKTMFRPLDSKSVKEIRRLAKKHNVNEQLAANDNQMVVEALYVLCK